MSPPCFTPEFKDEAVRQITDRGNSVADVSADSSTKGLMLLSQTKQTNKPLSCSLQKVKFSD